MIEMTPRPLPDPTAISVAAKERLAKLLATENVTVEHRNVPTAAFDIKNRVLVLPNWTDITKDVYDLLVCHEVGHALWTPFEGWHGAVSHKGSNYKGFLNVAEDARIEKKIQRKFPGARRSFVLGYKDLIARDFFGVNGRNLDSFGLIDRLNLHFKVGADAKVPFSDDEMVWVDRMGALESFEDSVALADDLYDAMSNDMAPETDTGRGEGEGEAEEGESESTPFGSDDAPSDGEADDTDGDSPDGTGDGDGEEDAGDEEEGDGSAEGENGEANEAEKAEGESGSTETETEGEDEEEEAEIPQSGGSGAGRNQGDGMLGGTPWSETDAAFRAKEGALVDIDDRNAPRYVQVAADDAFNLDAIIVDNKTVVKELKAGAFAEGGMGDIEAMAKKQVATYRNKNAKIINYLAKEFDMRKAADASKRTSVAKTGVLDMNTLHSFKWNDDIFKKVASVADGKSHGLQMFVDWSGSMSSNMHGTINQVLNLVLFCKKVGIPFDVYAFTDSYDSSWSRRRDPSDAEMPDRMNADKLTVGDIEFRKDGFNLLQIATSKGNKTAYHDMLMGLIILRGHFNHGYNRWQHGVDDCSWYNLDHKYGLGGTPLNEAIMASIPVINRFRRENGLQIVNSVFLTDGCGCDVSSAHGSAERPYGYGKTIIRDRKSRKEFVQKARYTSNDDEGMEQTPILLEMVRIRTGAKICNFYVANPTPKRFKREWMDSVPSAKDEFGYDIFDDVGAAAALKTAKADGGVLIENSVQGWDHQYLIMGGAELGASDDDGLDDSLLGAKKGKLKTAFGKLASGKMKNRVILRKFTELIAA